MAPFKIAVLLGAEPYQVYHAAGIAWEAHLGGFAAGLLTYGFFERLPVRPATDDDAAGAA